jgi:hypothetical protein
MGQHSSNARAGSTIRVNNLYTLTALFVVSQYGQFGDIANPNPVKFGDKGRKGIGWTAIHCGDDVTEFTSATRQRL